MLLTPVAEPKETEKSFVLPPDIAHIKPVVVKLQRPACRKVKKVGKGARGQKGTPVRRVWR